jgi:hypothetical protein
MNCVGRDYNLFDVDAENLKKALELSIKKAGKGESSYKNRL